MQTFPAALRIAQSVQSLAGADDALAAINTSEISPGAIVFVRSVAGLYYLDKGSVAAESQPSIIAPAQGGPGRWFKIGVGANYFQTINLPFPAIPPQSTNQVTVTVQGVLNSNDVMVMNSNDTATPNGVIIGQPKVVGLNQGSFRVLNATGATVPAATVGLVVAVLKGP